MEFLVVFSKVFFGMLEIFFIVLCGTLFFRAKLIDPKGLNGLTSLTINLFLPCLIFSHLIKHFDFKSLPDWWLYPLLGVAVSAFGLVIAYGVSFFRADKKYRNQLFAVIAFQNCGYLPLVLISSIFPEGLAQALFTRVFLFIQGFNLIFWGVAVRLLQPKGQRMVFKKFINPPLAALLFTSLLIAANMQVFIPTTLIKAAELLGNCALPAAIVSLGIILGSVLECRERLAVKFFSRAILGKLILMPIAALFVIHYLKIPKLPALLLLIEASMPSAINLGVVSYYQDTDYKIIGRAVLYTHLAAIITVPLFIAYFYSAG